MSLAIASLSVQGKEIEEAKTLHFSRLTFVFKQTPQSPQEAQIMLNQVQLPVWLHDLGPQKKPYRLLFARQFKHRVYAHLTPSASFSAQLWSEVQDENDLGAYSPSKTLTKSLEKLNPFLSRVGYSRIVTKPDVKATKIADVGEKQTFGPKPTPKLSRGIQPYAFYAPPSLDRLIISSGEMPKYIDLPAFNEQESQNSNVFDLTAARVSYVTGRGKVKSIWMSTFGGPFEGFYKEGDKKMTTAWESWWLLPSDPTQVSDYVHRNANYDTYYCYDRTTVDFSPYEPNNEGIDYDAHKFEVCEIPLWGSVNAAAVWAMPEMFNGDPASSNIYNNPIIAVLDDGYSNHFELKGRFLRSTKVGKTDANHFGFSTVESELNRPEGAFYSDDGEERKGEAGYHEPDSSHGMMVSSTISALCNNKPSDLDSDIEWSIASITCGSLPILPVRVIKDGSGDTDSITEALELLLETEFSPTNNSEHRIRVINMSLGSAEPEQCTETPDFQKAVDRLTEAGALVVVASGNEREEAGSYTMGNCKNTISVGSATPCGSMANYSNYGEFVDLMAPGGGMFDDDDPGRKHSCGLSHTEAVLNQSSYSHINSRTKLTLATTTNLGSPLSPTHIFTSARGTSFSAPMVAAALGLIFKAYPELTSVEGLYYLDKGLRPFGSFEVANINGGEGNPCMDGKHCGRGLLDVYNSVKLAVKDRKAGIRPKLQYPDELESIRHSYLDLPTKGSANAELPSGSGSFFAFLPWLLIAAWALIGTLLSRRYKAYIY